MENKYILELKNITKKYPGVTALDDVSFKVRKGSILSIVGENGAGKSTLLKIISGVVPAHKYDGNIFYDNQLVTFNNVNDSEKNGIAIIHQELAIEQHMTICENIFLNHYTSKMGLINWSDMVVRAKYYLRLVGLKNSPLEIAGNLTIAEQQLLEIAKALSKNARLIIFDEPTSSLNDSDSFALLDTMKMLRDTNGVTCVFVSHKLKEVEYVADEITIIRDGKYINSYDNSMKKINENQLIKDIVGRDLSQKFPAKTKRVLGEVAFEAKNVTVEHDKIRGYIVAKNASFNVRKSEIVGISGLVGSGRTELMMNIFGQTFGKRKSGEIFLNGAYQKLRTSKDAIKKGLMYASEDRKNVGLIQMMTVGENMSMSSGHIYSRYGVVNKSKEIVDSLRLHKELRIKVPDINYPTETLSGGNQQKVLIAKALMTNFDVLIIDEPTKGIDVGSKYEIYQILQDLAGKGKAIVVISSELEELLGITDRIYVMSQGEIKGQIETSKATPEKIMSIALGEQAMKGVINEK